jgi:hypothetical protein
MRRKRKSEYVAQVMREIRQAALKEKNDETRSKLWRWYYRLLHGEDEVEIIVKDTEVRCLLEIFLAYGMLPANWQEEIAKLEAKLRAEMEQQAPPVADIDDDDIPPRQLGLWDEDNL